MSYHTLDCHSRTSGLYVMLDHVGRDKVMYSFVAKVLLGHLPAVLVRGTLGMGGLGIIFWGLWKRVMEGSPDPGGKTESWGRG